MSTIQYPPLSELETKAHHHIQVATDNWILAIETIQQIQDSELWREKADTWQDYFFDEFSPKLNFGYSRLRQYTAALPFARYVHAETGVLLNERQARDLKALGYGNDDKSIELVSLAQAAADEMEEPLRAKHLKSAHKVLFERDATSGNISLDGESVPITVIDPVQVAIVQEAHEANQRQTQYIKDKNPSTKLIGTIQAVHDNHGVICLAVVLPDATLADIGRDAIVYINIEADSEQMLLAG